MSIAETLRAMDKVRGNAINMVGCSAVSVDKLVPMACFHAVRFYEKGKVGDVESRQPNTAATCVAFTLHRVQNSRTAESSEGLERLQTWTA